jgi:hypothetical protein
MKINESNVSADRAHSLITENKENPDFVILDVRMDEEVETGFESRQ